MFRRRRIFQCELPVCTGQAAEGRDQAGEDQDEDDVSAEGTDHVDEAKNSHPEHEEGCGGGVSQLRLVL